MAEENEDVNARTSMLLRNAVVVELRAVLAPDGWSGKRATDADTARARPTSRGPAIDIEEDSAGRALLAQSRAE
ncbi:hypothetical protein E4U53_001430 [Claviceps sorghi]|nr:hypothetical protein E4U53_001430 [Claviceps sorghi]